MTNYQESHRDISSAYPRREYEALRKALLEGGTTEDQLEDNHMGSYEEWAYFQTLNAFLDGPSGHNWHRHTEPGGS